MMEQMHWKVESMFLEKRVGEIVSALRTIEDLKGLTEEEFTWLAIHGTERLGDDGDLIFSQGTPPHHLMFILSGEVLVHRHSSSPVSVLIGQTGRITGKTPFSRIKAWNADGRSSGKTWILELHDSYFSELLNAIPSMTQRIVRVLLDRNREYTRAEEQIGKLAALNKLAANLAHELNNPASAAKSAASQLLSMSDADHEKTRYRVGMALGAEDKLNAYLDWLSKLRSQVSFSRHSATENAFAESALLEDSLTSWLESKGFAEAWKLAPILVESGVPLSLLQELEQLVPTQSLCLVICDVQETVASYKAMLSVADAADRIFRLVTAVKDYSYMDRQPVQDVNISASLDIVLKLTQPKLTGITVRRFYSPDVPLLKAFGSELNQVWAALIENSLDAMAGSGTLTLSTRLQGNTVLVEVTDTGQGIPPECANRVFEPFFTTKPFGTGLGLRLDTVQRVVQKHFGSVAFDSQPNKTTFQVRLPIDRTEVY
ncbi:sensor histidine kinase [Acidicapsa ligni]|uniref:sensor histidine kinase n=1 Tax=Acidicapsa ligni TaxID=542300 RepID=UPI0021E08114|nr:ATP-binding protein [Acidicapsa ligni]